MIPAKGAITCAMHMTDGMTSLTFGVETKFAPAFDTVLESWNQGCAELFIELSYYAELCNELFWETYNEEQSAPGVYDYEVSYEFGQWFGKYVLDEGNVPDRREANIKLCDLAAAYWNQIGNYMYNINEWRLYELEN